MDKQTTTPTFPMFLHGIEVSNREEARLVLQLVAEDRAKQDTLQYEEQLRHVMKERGLSAYDAKIYLLNGGTSCGSVSSWL